MDFWYFYMIIRTTYDKPHIEYTIEEYSRKIINRSNNKKAPVIVKLIYFSQRSEFKTR